MNKKSEEKGISLIALIITIIVIIILAAIVIGGVFNTPSQAKFSKWCDEIGRLQDAIMSAHGSRAAQVATDSNFDRIDNSRIYKYIATKNENASVELIRKKEMVMIDKNNNTLNTEIPNYDNQNWYIDLSTGQIYMTPGITYEESIYMSEEDIKNGGCETRTPIDTTGTISYVGRYADIDGDGNIDGVIYADLLAQKNEHGQWANDSGTFTITTGITSDNVKDYVISQTGASNARFEKSGVDLRTYVKGNVIKLASSSTGTKDRFYVMGLDDINANQNPTWYASATGKMSPLITSNNFGEGKENTRKMIAKWNAAGTEDGYADAAKGDQDVWNYIQSGWFLPSRDEWAAFAKAFNISKTSTDVTYYGNYMLSDFYWSSSQYSAYSAWDARFSKGGMNYYSVHGTRFGRLSTTF